MVGMFALFYCLGNSQVQAAPQAAGVDFVRDVRPIFQEFCYHCHSEDEQESGLRLDVKRLALKGGDRHGPDIVPGDSDASPLIRFVSAAEDDPLLMPPGERLSEEQIDTLRRWVQAGAVWPDGVDLVELPDTRDHWSFKPLTVADSDQSLDDFVRGRLLDAGLDFAREVKPSVWLRRVTLDLTGLPPSPTEVATFETSMADVDTPEDRAAVYRSTVDRLLTSERYGERWGQHWLDVVRYADTHGFEVNTERPNAWHYRDYVIRSFNADKPYDEFVREQIAGDLLGADTATGFLITASVLLPGQIGQDAASKRLARQDALDEIVNNISQTFLGLSVGCARCHDHKFDPISAKDYYAMQAFVAGVEYEDRMIPSPQAAARVPEIVSLKTALEALRTRYEDQQSKRGLDAVTPTSARENSISFPPTRSKFIRFTIYDANVHPTLGLIEPCVDEFEIFSVDDPSQNVALSQNGTKVTASGSRSSDAHQLAHVNDGEYGNHRSWMSDTAGTGWLLFELPAEVSIDRVVWSRDRLGQFEDRTATIYSLEVGPSLDQMSVVAGVDEATRDMLSEMKRMEEQLRVLEEPMAVFAGKFRAPDSIFLLNRGDPEQPGVAVPPAVPESLGSLTLPMETQEAQRRLALADWLADTNNPLTARVIVNRVWHWHFGTGLVASPSDLGNSGLPPSHPELLDWLASQFMADGWSIKNLHRKIVLSRTYRQTSAIDPRSAEIDADNRLLWRFRSRRLEAEVIRDSMLAVAGLLKHDMYGRGFDLFDQRGGLSGFIPVETLNDFNQRRMIYAHKIRREPEAVFGAFDCPDAGQSTAVRAISTTPIQALNLFNSPFTLEVADRFAQRIRGEVGDEDVAQIRRAYEIALNRLPTNEEVEEVRGVVQQYGLALLCRVLLNSNEFLFIP